MGIYFVSYSYIKLWLFWLSKKSCDCFPFLYIYRYVYIWELASPSFMSILSNSLPLLKNKTWETHKKWYQYIFISYASLIAFIFRFCYLISSWILFYLISSCILFYLISPYVINISFRFLYFMISFTLWKYIDFLFYSPNCCVCIETLQISVFLLLFCQQDAKFMYRRVWIPFIIRDKEIIFLDILSIFEYFLDLGIHDQDYEELKENPSEIWC